MEATREEAVVAERAFDLEAAALVAGDRPLVGRDHIEPGLVKPEIVEEVAQEGIEGILSEALAAGFGGAQVEADGGLAIARVVRSEPDRSEQLPVEVLDSQGLAFLGRGLVELGIEPGVEFVAAADATPRAHLAPELGVVPPGVERLAVLALEGPEANVLSLKHGVSQQRGRGKTSPGQRLDVTISSSWP